MADPQARHREFQAIEKRVIRPAIDGKMPCAGGSDGMASARTAALVDPEGESLQRCIDTLEHGPMPAAAE